MFSPKNYALHSRSFKVIDQDDSQIRLKDLSINGLYKN